MHSPITGKDMKLTRERSSMDFRKETFEIMFHSYRCEDSGEQFTTTSLDELNTNQVYNKYRDKFNIPFQDEIIRIREKYGLAAAKMSEILGFGINSYRQYEAGEMPSIANAKSIQMLDEPKYFIDMVEMCGTLDEKVKTKCIQKAQLLIEEKKRNNVDLKFKEYVLGNHFPDIYTGYRNPNFEKFTEMVVYFSEQNAPFKTKMNKLLFYADFLMFKQSCFSISGIRYQAIDMGPVPNNFQSIFEYLAKNGEIDILATEIPQGYTGEQFKAKQDRPFKSYLFSETELEVMKKVSLVFQSSNSIDIIELSHLEEAWKKNEKNKSAISYEYAFDLNPMEYEAIHI
ncbi:MAG: type II toxin-antitoxin system antitoxin SocA domain-containing protein [Saprospiraceae bacterium]